MHLYNTLVAIYVIRISKSCTFGIIYNEIQSLHVRCASYGSFDDVDMFDQVCSVLSVDLNYAIYKVLLTLLWEDTDYPKA